MKKIVPNRLLNRTFFIRMLLGTPTLAGCSPLVIPPTPHDIDPVRAHDVRTVLVVTGGKAAKKREVVVPDQTQSAQHVEQEALRRYGKQHAAHIEPNVECKTITAEDNTMESREKSPKKVEWRDVESLQTVDSDALRTEELKQASADAEARRLLTPQERAAFSEMKADRAWEEEMKIEQDTAETQELIKHAREELSEMEAELQHARAALREIKKAPAAMRQAGPHGTTEGIFDKVEEAALVMKDAVVGVAHAVSNTIRAGAHATHDLVSSSAARAKTAVEKARQRHAYHKTRVAEAERSEAQRDLAALVEHINKVEKQLEEVHARTKNTEAPLYDTHTKGEINQDLQ